MRADSNVAWEIWPPLSVSLASYNSKHVTIYNSKAYNFNCYNTNKIIILLTLFLFVATSTVLYSSLTLHVPYNMMHLPQLYFTVQYTHCNKCRTLGGSGFGEIKIDTVAAIFAAGHT